MASSNLAKINTSIPIKTGIDANTVTMGDVNTSVFNNTKSGKTFTFSTNSGMCGGTSRELYLYTPITATDGKSLTCDMIKVSVDKKIPGLTIQNECWTGREGRFMYFGKPTTCNATDLNGSYNLTIESKDGVYKDTFKLVFKY